jgi:hypothetical protein
LVCRKGASEMQRIGLLIGALLLVHAVGASAQTTTRIEGTVAAIDPVAKTVTFTDGRVVRFDPNSRIFVNGREVTYSEVRPGVVVVMTPAAAPPATVVVPGSPAPAPPPAAVIVPGPPQQAMAPSTAWPRSYSFVDANGVVADVDRANGIITFQDGRMVRISSDGRVWQAVGMGTIQPGHEVYVTNAMPVGFRSAGAVSTGSWGSQDLMGRVINVDPTGSQILLNDGTLVTVTASTRMAMSGGQTVAIKDLKPGDQVVVRVKSTAPPTTPATAQVVVPAGRVVTDQPAGSPPSVHRIIEADQIIVIRYPQAP